MKCFQAVCIGVLDRIPSIGHMNCDNVLVEFCNNLKARKFDQAIAEAEATFQPSRDWFSNYDSSTSRPIIAGDPASSNQPRTPYGQGNDGVGV